MPMTMVFDVLTMSGAGFALAALTLWSRRRPGLSAPGRLVLLFTGTAVVLPALGAAVSLFGDAPVRLAMTVTIMLTAWAAAMNAAVHLPLPSRYMTVRSAERTFYRNPWSGVRAFGRLLRSTPLRTLGGTVYLHGRRNDAPAVTQGMLAAEAAHVWAVIVSIPLLLVWGIGAEWSALAGALAVHLPLNIMPLLHLRHARSRLERALPPQR